MQTTEQIPELQPITDRMKFEQGQLLCKVEIDCRTAYYAIPCGHLVGFGKQIVTVRKSDVPLLMAQVETEPEEIKAAQRRYDIGLEKYLDENCEGIDAGYRAARREQLKAEYALSMEAIFYRDTGRNIKPFISVRLLEDNIPIPADAAASEQQNSIAAEVAKAVATALAGLIQPNQQQKKS